MAVFRGEWVLARRGLESLNIGKYLVKTGNKDADELVVNCLKRKPNNRIKEISTHKFFKNVLLEPSFKPGLAKILKNNDEEIKDIPGEFYAIEREYERRLYEETLRIPTDEYLSNLE